MDKQDYNPPVSEEFLDRGSSSFSSFASLGPIYWLGDGEEGLGSYRDENGNVIHYAVDMADDNSQNRFQLVTILSICVIIASVILIGIMCYYWRLWTKQQRELNRVQTVEEVKI